MLFDKFTVLMNASFKLYKFQDGGEQMGQLLQACVHRLLLINITGTFNDISSVASPICQEGQSERTLPI